jgi:YbgC/YbaW family acyl-CoA thioester hydrolase
MIKDTFTIRPRYEEVDQMGYVYHANYVAYCHQARTELLSKIGINDKILEDNGIMLPVISFNIEYKKPAYYDELLTIQTIIKELPAVRFIFKFEIRDSQNILLSKANSTVVFVDSKNGAPIKRYRKMDNSYIGLSLSRTEIDKKFNLWLSEKPVHISDEIIFLGEIPRVNSFEAQITTFIDENGKPDFFPDDSALAVINNNKLVIVSGCAHAGICNTIEYAKKVTGINNVQAVIGGFHLKYDNQQTQMTIQYFQNNNIEEVYPSHCTELPALAAFYKMFGSKQVKTGNVYMF